MKNYKLLLNGSVIADLFFKTDKKAMEYLDSMSALFYSCGATTAVISKYKNEMDISIHTNKGNFKYLLVKTKK